MALVITILVPRSLGAKPNEVVGKPKKVKGKKKSPLGSKEREESSARGVGARTQSELFYERYGARRYA